MPDYVYIFNGQKYTANAININSYQNIGTLTTVTLANLSQVNYNTSFTLTATINSTTTVAAGGTLTLQKLSGTSWVTVATSTLSFAGGSTPWSSTASFTGLKQTTVTTYRVLYGGDSSYRNATSNSVTVKCWGSKTTTKTFSCYAARSHYNVGSNTYSSLIRSGTDLYQGYESSYGKEVSQVLFDNGSAVPYYLNAEGGGGSTSTILGYFNSLSKVTISKVELYLNCKSWSVSSGGTAYIFPDGSYILQPSGGIDFTYYSGVATATSASWSTVSGAKWIDISSLTYYGFPAIGLWDFNNGGQQSLWSFTNGINLARNSTSNIYAGHFTGNDNTTSEPQLRFTFTYYTYL
jgi:hypothetical protein